MGFLKTSFSLEVVEDSDGRRHWGLAVDTRKQFSSAMLAASNFLCYSFTCVDFQQTVSTV